MLEEGGGPLVHDAMLATKKPRKAQVKRKQTTYEVRKERKRQLVEQVERMQDKLDELKLRLLVEQGGVHKATKRTKAENAVLYEFIQQRHLVHAATQAALTSHVQRSLGSLQPVQSVIWLGTDQGERYNTLKRLKDSQLNMAEIYLKTRSYGLDPASSYCQEERFDSPDGDYCLVRFETVPVRGANAKEVLGAILYAVLNAEMVLSEMFSTVTIREDSDYETTDFAQVRLATATSPGTTVESNTVVFSRFVDEAEDGGAGSYGVMVGDFVDCDELYPYRTGERVRRDTTTLVMARSIPVKDEKSPEVVITRWTCLKIHRNSRSISKDPEREMAETSVCYGDTAHRSIQQQLVHATTIDSPTS